MTYGEPIVHELDAPSDVAHHGGREVLRCFLVDDTLHVSLADAFERSETWGVLLADVARHIADMMSNAGGLRDQALNDIHRSFQAESSDGRPNL